MKLADEPALVSFHQQIHTYQSKLPLPISNPTVTIIQHYLDVSPVCEEILNAWKEGDRVGHHAASRMPQGSIVSSILMS